MIQWTEKFHYKNRIQAIKQFKESHMTMSMRKHCTNTAQMTWVFIFYSIKSLYDGSITGMGAKFMDYAAYLSILIPSDLQLIKDPSCNTL